MGHGRPDYWVGVSTGLASPGGGQFLYRDFEEGDIASGATLDMCLYTVPTDRILYITTLLIHARSMAVNGIRVNINGAWVDNMQFWRDLYLPFHPSALYEVLQGQSFFLRLYNHDIYQKHFGCTVIGFEEMG